MQRTSALSQFNSWLTFRRLSSCLSVPVLCAALLLAAGAGFGQGNPAAAGADQHPNAGQVWTPQLNAADRCATCHPQLPPPNTTQLSLQQPNRVDPLVPHHTKDWGCTVCHRGQGAAAEKEQAHQPELAPAQPLLPTSYIQASCGICHRADLPDTPQLNRGRLLLSEFGCLGCHRLEGIERPAMLGPDLTDIGSKVSAEWIYKWLKEPRTIIDDAGNAIVSGYQMEPRMPQFRLNEEELRDLSAYLSSLRSKPLEPYKFDPQVVAALENSPDLVDQGEARFRQMFCTTCHSLAVTRGGETKLIGGDIGPEMTKVGSKVNPDWLVAWLRNPQAFLPKSKMPRYEWSDQDLYVVTRFISTKLTDPDLLQGIPKLGAPTPEQIRFGRRQFLKKGCGSCHAVSGMKLQEDFGPNLASLGAESISHLHFGNAKIPRSLVAYLQAKISDPISVNPTAEMPQYRFNSADLDAMTTALLSMTGAPSSGAMERLIVPRTQAEFHPTGAFAQVYERYKCYVCHQFNGYGGTLATDLSYEGSRAQRQWLIDFLKNPQTLRPSLILRMPQFNMTDQEASILADSIGRDLRSPAVNPASVEPAQFTPQMAALGKQLYEVKYQCQACHSIGAGGGYVGPDLSNVGNWMTAAWIEAWLKDPQALLPGGIEPRRALAEDEVKALTAYLMTLRQSEPAGRAAAAAGVGQ
ncbi:MAG: c-type cytochrome [Acidobacteriia bacterium]|nr:c-type cytochrome [Terriglobia bacterium]